MEAITGNGQRSGSKGMLESLNVGSIVERCPSGIHLVRGYRGESRIYCDFNTTKPAAGMKVWSRLAIEAGCEELVQPRGQDDDPRIILQTDLSNTSEYSRQMLRASDTKCR
jgi:hypothetical protein